MTVNKIEQLVVNFGQSVFLTSHPNCEMKMPIFQIFYYIILMFFFLLLGCGLFFRYCSSSAGKAEDRKNIFECQIHE